MQTPFKVSSFNYWGDGCCLESIPGYQT